jgi:hypothetical protein
VSAMCRISLVSDLYTIAFLVSLRSTIVSNGFRVEPRPNSPP